MKPAIPRTAWLVATLALLLFHITPSFAGSRFHASINPLLMKFTVTAQGGITGNRYATVQVNREPVGNTTVCTKIRWVDIVRGTDPRSESLGWTRLNPRRCFFRKAVRVRPFTDQEIRDICKGVSGGTIQKLEAQGLVNIWHKNWELEQVKSIPPNDSTPVRFTADVQCGSRARLPSPPQPSTPSSGNADSSGSMRCELSGDWSVYDKGRKQTHSYHFSKIFSASGNKVYRAIVRRGKRQDEVGTLTQTPQGNYLFHWVDGLNIPTGRGRYKHTYLMVMKQGANCNRMDEDHRITSRGKSRRAMVLKRQIIDRGNATISRPNPAGWQKNRPSR